MLCGALATTTESSKHPSLFRSSTSAATPPSPSSKATVGKRVLKNSRSVVASLVSSCKALHFLMASIDSMEHCVVASWRLHFCVHFGVFKLVHETSCTESCRHQSSHSARCPSTHLQRKQLMDFLCVSKCRICLHIFRYFRDSRCLSLFEVPLHPHPQIAVKVISRCRNKKARSCVVVVATYK